MAYRVYEYGIHRMVSGEEFLVDQIFKKNHYWNKLVEIEKGHQERREQLIISFSPHLVDLEQAVEKAQASVNYWLERQAVEKKETRSSSASDITRRALAHARRRLKDARAQYRAERKTAFAGQELKDALKALNAEHTESVRLSRREHAAVGLYWGNYLQVEAAYKTARRRVGNRLKFHRSRPEGKVGVQFQQGLRVTDVHGTDNRLIIQRVPEEAWTSDIRSARRKLARTRVWMWLGRGEDGKPVHCEAQMVFHRPMPATGVIKEAAIIRERVGTRHRYRLVVTVDVGDAKPSATNGRVYGIDVGWRQLDHGLRVAVGVSDSGRSHELILPDDLRAGFDEVDGLRSTRDKNFHAVTKLLSDMLKTLKLPEDLQERLDHLVQWRSEARLARAILYWRDHRFDGDESAYDLAETWRKRDKHLLEWETNLRDKLIRRRREWYRVYAAGLAASADRVVLEAFDLRAVTKRDVDGWHNQEAANARFVVSVSQLRTIIEQTCAREGISVVRAPAEWTTQRCHVCHEVDGFDAASELEHTCPRGHRWDQDFNAARNLLQIDAEERSKEVARTSGG